MRELELNEEIAGSLLKLALILFQLLILYRMTIRFYQDIQDQPPVRWLRRQALHLQQRVAQQPLPEAMNALEQRFAEEDANALARQHNVENFFGSARRVINLIRNQLMETGMIVAHPLSATNAITIATTAHLGFFLAEDMRRLSIENHHTPHYELVLAILLLGMPEIHKYSQHVMQFLLEDTPTFLRRVQRHGLRPIKELITFSNATFFIIFYHCGPWPFLLMTPKPPIVFLSPVTALGEILNLHRMYTALVSDLTATNERIIGASIGAARRHSQSLWSTLGHRPVQPVPSHDFSNMTEDELTCPIAYTIPNPDDAIVIANDRHRQVYDGNVLKEWVRAAPRNLQGLVANPRTQTDFFSEVHIVPVPETVKEQIRAIQATAVAVIR